MDKKLRVYHIPNPPAGAFYFPVSDIQTAKLVLNVLACLDLENLASRIHEINPERKGFIDRVASAYKAYRRARSINGAWLINCNVGGLEELDENGWGEWYDEMGDDITEIMRGESMFPE